MITLNKYMQLVEGLSQENVDRLSKILNDDDITDELIKRVKHLVNKTSLKKHNEGELASTLSKYLIDHGISSDTIKTEAVRNKPKNIKTAEAKNNGNEEILDRFLDWFSVDEDDSLENTKDKNVQRLSFIKPEKEGEKAGIISWNDFIKDGKGNVKAICKDGGFSEFITNKIMTWQPTANSNNAAMGFGEVLLRFIIKESSPMEKGDISITNNEGFFGVELKNTNDKGGRPFGQSHTARDMVEFDKAFVDELYGKDNNFLTRLTTAAKDDKTERRAVNTTKGNDVLRITQRQVTLKHAFQILSDDKKLDKIGVAIVKGVKAQYADAGEIDAGQIKSYIEKNQNGNALLDCIGYAQACAYRNQEGFKYLCLLNSDTGDYVVLGDEAFKNIDIFLKNVKFGPTSSGTGRERACRFQLRSEKTISE